MGFKETIDALMDRYYKDILESYKVTAMHSMKASRKMGLFKKMDYSPYIQDFKRYAGEADEIRAELEDLSPSEDDSAGRDLLKAFRVSLRSFSDLCQRNAEHYDLMDRKQYRKNAVTLEDIKLSISGVNAIMGPALETLDILDRAYKLYHGESVELNEDDIRQDYREEDEV